MPDKLLEIDGNVFEGGGQILRMSMCLSAILRMPIKVSKIRAERSNPGLAAQHLCGIKLVAEMSRGKLEGAFIGSTEITFHPGKIIKGGFYKADIQTAGSISLIIQVALPCALYADSEVVLDLRGGTNLVNAPSIEYIEQVFFKNLAKFGGVANVQVLRQGYAPDGLGHVQVRIHPVVMLSTIKLTHLSEIARINGQSFVSLLPESIAETMRAGALSVLTSRNICDKIDISPIKIVPPKATGICNGILIVCESQSGAVIGTSGLGGDEEEPFTLGKKVAEEICDYCQHGIPFDDNMQDMIIILMALAKGESKVRVGELTMHTRGAIHIVEMFCIFVKFNVTPDGPTNIIKCRGPGVYNFNFMKQMLTRFV